MELQVRHAHALPLGSVGTRAPNGPAKLKDCGPGLLSKKDL